MSCNFQKRKPAVFILLLLIYSFSSANCQKNGSNTSERLRTEYKKMSKDDAKLMLKQKKFFDKYWNKAGDFKNKFESKKINQDEIVIDDATGLMWHPSGSSKFVNLKEASEWISELNKENYAGYSDWRLPTLEEAASLLENSKKRNLYIDRAFDRRQWCIWTGDTLSTNLTWVVVFSGRIDWFEKNVRMNYVRPVRSLTQ